MPATPRLPLAALLLSLAGCQTDITTYSLLCDVLLTDATPAEGLPGARVTLTGTPLSSVWDTAIYLDNARAVVLDVSREGCDECDTCREDNDCTACSDCDACDAACDAECVETATFEVPSLEGGVKQLTLFNSRGRSNTLSFTVLAPADTSDDTATGDDTAPGDDTATGDDTAPGDDTATGDDTAPGDDTATGDDTAAGDDTAISDDTAR